MKPSLRNSVVSLALTCDSYRKLLRDLLANELTNAQVEARLRQIEQEKADEQRH